MKNRVIVTGGSGFIGTNLVESLRDSYSILNIDIEKPKIDEHFKHWKQIDVLDFGNLENAIIQYNPSYIIHLAAVTDLNGRSLSYYETNIKGTQNIIDIACKLKSIKKIVFTSSMYVCRPGIIPQTYDMYHPHTLYGESKVIGEKLVKSIKSPHYEWIIVRPTSIWGPWFSTPYIDFFKVVYDRRYFNFGKACTKTYGYVANTVYQIMHLIDADGVHGKTFYLGDKPAIQISEWADEISLCMAKGKIRSIPFPILKCAAYIGDILTKFQFKFPITSFRLNNMTTNNVVPLGDLYDIVGEPPYARSEGVRNTIEWLIQHKGY
jgi:GlcNAc-P-P-Und epimerase